MHKRYKISLPFNRYNNCKPSCSLKTSAFMFLLLALSNWLFSQEANYILEPDFTKVLSAQNSAFVGVRGKLVVNESFSANHLASANNESRNKLSVEYSLPFFKNSELVNLSLGVHSGLFENTNRRDLSFRFSLANQFKFNNVGTFSLGANVNYGNYENVIYNGVFYGEIIHGRVARLSHLENREISFSSQYFSYGLGVFYESKSKNAYAGLAYQSLPNYLDIDSDYYSRAKQNLSFAMGGRAELGEKFSMQPNLMINSNLIQPNQSEILYELLMAGNLKFYYKNQFYFGPAANSELYLGGIIGGKFYQGSKGELEMSACFMGAESFNHGEYQLAFNLSYCLPQKSQAKGYY